MKAWPREDIGPRLEALAAVMLVPLPALVAATSLKLIQATPGKFADDEKPLPLGSLINLRREMPNGPRRLLDVNWYVAGYICRRDRRWEGYVLARPALAGPLLVEVTTAARCEAFDVLHRAPTPATVPA